MNDLPTGRPAASGPVPSEPVPAQAPGRTTGYPLGGMRSRMDARPIWLGSMIGFFIGLMILFILAAAAAQLVVRGDRQAEQAPTAPAAPPVTQEQVPAKPAPPADGNPAGATSPEAVTP